MNRISNAHLGWLRTNVLTETNLCYLKWRQSIISYRLHHRHWCNPLRWRHNGCDITSLTIVYSTIYSDADQSKHQSSASLAFVWGIHRGPVNSPHEWPVTRKIFPFDDVIMIPLTHWDQAKIAATSQTFSNVFSSIKMDECRYIFHWNLGQINNIPALVQIMAWCRSGNKPLSEPMMVRLPTHIYATMPYWVNSVPVKQPCRM